jgi:shikimate kinase
VVLVGFMGSGKSTVAPLLARRLGWDHLDMDAEIERRSGLPVPEIFRQRGEATFREQEKSLALDLVHLQALVVAAGGGAFALPETREILRREAAAVWLRCDLETVMARLPADGSRPLAANRETIAALFTARQPSYSLADWTFDSARLHPEALAREIAEAVFPGRPSGAPRTSGR